MAWIEKELAAFLLLLPPGFLSKMGEPRLRTECSKSIGFGDEITIHPLKCCVTLGN